MNCISLKKQRPPATKIDRPFSMNGRRSPLLDQQSAASDQNLIFERWVFESGVSLSDRVKLDIIIAALYLDCYQLW